MKVAFLTGSNRSNSTSTKLARYVEQTLWSRGHRTTFFDLYASPVALYDPEQKQFEGNEARLISEIHDADAFVVSTAEYHGGMTGVLKNAFDYLSFEQFQNKPVLLISSSGGQNSMSSLQQLALTVRHLHGVVCPEWISIGRGTKDFTVDGVPTHRAVIERVENSVTIFEKITIK